MPALKYAAVILLFIVSLAAFYVSTWVAHTRYINSACVSMREGVPYTSVQTKFDSLLLAKVRYTNNLDKEIAIGSYLIPFLITCQLYFAPNDENNAYVTSGHQVINGITIMPLNRTINLL